MTRKVLLHVGTPKTGTSYLQHVLLMNRRLLAGHGILYPADRHDAHFLAGLDLMRLPWGGLEREAVGAWDALAEQVRAWHGDTAIISHEILAGASRSQVGRALESLGARDGVEVHLVLSVRDLVRQIPAEWQENVKHRSGMSYARFLALITDPSRNSRIASWFWSVQEVPEILDRWGTDLPPERVHVVTVPSPGGAPDVLWKRFSQAFALEGIDLDLADERSNPSLGVPETALIRRINRSANRVLTAGRLPPPGARAAGAPDAVAAGAVAAAGAAARAGAVGAGARGGVRRRDRAARLRRRRRPPRPAGQPRPCTRTSIPTARASATSPAPRSTPSRRCCSTTPACAPTTPSCAPSSTRRATRCGGPTCGRRTASARRR